MALMPLLASAQTTRTGALKDETMTLERAEKLVPRLPMHPQKSLIHSNAPVIDTLETSDPRVQMVIFEDHTWVYIKNGMEDTEIFQTRWDEKAVNPFHKTVADLPPKVTLFLVDSLSDFVVPHQTKVFSKFGRRRGRQHMGVDLPYPTGTPVHAAFDGKVRVSMYYKGFGNVIIIRHENGLETVYGHLSKRLKEPGDWVHAGDVIGLGGSTGRSTGPHLHFETRYQGLAFDPQWIIDFEKGKLRQSVFVLKKKYLDPNSQYVPESDDEEEEIYGEDERIQAEAERKAKELAAAQYYKIKSGDTLGAIAIRYHTSVNAICRLNGITPKTTLKIGRTIRVK